MSHEPRTYDKIKSETVTALWVVCIDLYFLGSQKLHSDELRLSIVIKIEKKKLDFSPLNRIMRN